jgi:hypothetical protein
MPRVALIHWKEEEAPERLARLRKAGFAAEAPPTHGTELLRALRADPPDAVVISLERLPSHGREAGTALRMSKPTRRIPLVFVGGAPEKVERVKADLPDAVYCSWRGIRGAVNRAIARAPAEPVLPRADGICSRAPLARKLGIKAGTAVGLVGAPEGFEATLGERPEGVVLRRGARGRCERILWFVRSARDLRSRIGRIAERARESAVWICWPKKASGVKTDLTQNVVRQTGLDAGIVDYKICAVDETWSGLLFTESVR